MQRINMLFSFGLLLFMSLVVMGEEQLPPSNYVGIFNRFGNFENGKIPFQGTPYTGKWEYRNKDNNEYLCGYYKQGAPFGLWILYYSSGVPSKLYAYDKENFTSNSYYPDGINEIYSFGKIKMTKDSFSHIQTNTCHWNPAGEKITDSKERFAKSKGWHWVENERIMLYKSRDAVINNVNVSMGTFLNNSNSVMLAIYFYTSDTFLGKLLMEATLNHQSGKLDVCKPNVFGFTENITYEIGVINPPAEDSSRIKEIGFDVILLSPKKDKQIIPLTRKIEFISQNK